MRRTIATVAMSGWLLVGCGGDDSASDPGGTEASAVLRPAEDVRSEEQQARYVTHTINESVEVVNGVFVMVTSMTVTTDDESGFLNVSARVENRATVEGNVPEFSIACSGNDETGGWMADSTLELYADLPGESFDDGVVVLTLPGDGRYGEPVPECVGPAYLVVSYNSMDDDSIHAWQIDDSLRVALNDAAAAGVGLTPD